MDNLKHEIEKHYLKEGLFEDIINRLVEKGINLDNVTRADISGVDEFHVRGAAISKELANTIDIKGAHILDVGCGLGGPCRMLADEFDCRCTGIDLSKEYIRTATGLSRLVKLDDKTNFVYGDATILPFEEETFDVVWTQHAQMNIPEKDKLYSEIERVLKSSGYFIYYDIFKTGNGEIKYPMPWATNKDQSFLLKTMEMEQILIDLGFSRVQAIDQTSAGIDFFEALVVKLNDAGPPKLGLNVLMGESTKPKLMNLLAHLKEDKLAIQSGVFRK